jgi:hypothetical protein
MVIVLDAALNESLFPKGFTETQSGRTYHRAIEG